MRASDADRETVAERLRRAAVDGRLLAHELEDRLARALRAKTYGELDALVADLPRELGRRQSRSRQLARSHPVMAVAIVTAAAIAAVAVMIVVAFVLAAIAVLWGLWLLFASALAARRGVRYQPRARYAYRYGAWAAQRGHHRCRYGSWM
jgi:hypothetical protein